MSRKYTLKHVDKNGLGLEIGPSFNPVAPKKDGYHVEIIDHMSRDGLIEKYKNDSVKANNIEEVDFVWGGEPYTELTGHHKHYDWIIASHVIEHTPDLIGFLNECDSVLKDDGVVSLVIPDKRYCFDHFRPISGLSSVIDHHIQKNTIHTPGKVAECFLNVVSKSGSIAWNSSDNGAYKLQHSVEDAIDRMHCVINNNEFIDVHSWCFVPHSFRQLINDLYELNLSSLQEVDFHSTEGCEFFITLGRQGKGLDIARLEMLKIIELEIKEDIAPPKKIKDRLKNIIKHIIRRNR